VSEGVLGGGEPTNQLVTEGQRQSAQMLCLEDTVVRQQQIVATELYANGGFV
jgi:hypothetical protein